MKIWFAAIVLAMITLSTPAHANSPVVHFLDFQGKSKLIFRSTESDASYFAQYVLWDTGEAQEIWCITYPTSGQICNASFSGYWNQTPHLRIVITNTPPSWVGSGGSDLEYVVESGSDAFRDVNDPTRRWELVRN
jgi:hypothetical protein